jgi:hypothetical protein
VSHKLDFSYDDWRDILTVEGAQYSGDLFRALARGLQLNQPFMIIERKDGVVTIQTLYEDTSNWLVEKK